MDFSGSDKSLYSVTEFTAMIGREWNKMTAEEKLSYRHNAEHGISILRKSKELAAKEQATASSKNTD